MQIIDVLTSAQGGAAMANVGRAFGLSDAQAEAVVRAVVPEISRRIERNTLSRGGLADLVGALGQGHHQAYLDNPRLIGREETRVEGNAILDHVLGGKDTSRAVAERASAMSGVSSSIIRMMLPIIASMVMGALSKSASGGLGEILGRMGGARPTGPGGGSAGSGMPRLPEMPGGGGLGVPDMAPRRPAPPPGGGTGGWGGAPASGSPGEVRMNPDGGLQIPDNLPDFGGGAPQPRRGADNPYGDLADILRRGMGLPGGGAGVPMPRGGAPVPQDTGGGLPFPMPSGGGVALPGGAVGGGLLWRIVRSVLGSALGFQSKGFMSWIVRLVLMRWGWGLLKAILGRGIGR